MAEEFTTVQIDIETREKLREIAGEDYRSIAAELRWLVNQEYAKRQTIITEADIDLIIIALKKVGITDPSEVL